MMPHYVGILDRGPDVWGVTLPDVPGCVGAGETVEDAIESATEALSLVALHRHQGGFPMPMATRVEDVIGSGHYGATPVLVMIPVLVDGLGRGHAA